MVRKVMSDPLCHYESSAIVDLRAASYEPGDMAEVIRIAKTLEAFHSMLGSSIAIVARRSTIFFAEIFSAHVRAAANVAVKVFVELSAAEAFCAEHCVTVSHEAKSGMT
jgi:hypothetical protein